MENLILARSQMGMSLAFHIIFATIGVSLPLMMTISEWRWRSTGRSSLPITGKWRFRETDSRWPNACSPGLAYRTRRRDRGIGGFPGAVVP
jgi:hypothetical protein